MQPERKARLSTRHLLLAFLLLATGAAVWLTAPEDGADDGAYAVASREEVVRAVYATGTVEPVYWAMLSPEETGRLMEIVHNEGEAITKGDVVARMDDSVAKARLREAQERLTFLTNEVQRQRTLVESNAVSRSKAENVEREYGEARARMQAILQEIENLKLVAPVDGVVLRREVEIGETVRAGDPAFWVGNPTPLRITAEVDEEDIGQVALGQVALIKADAFPNQVFEGKVDEITPQGDPVNKVFRVRLALPDDVPLMINMTTEVNIVVDHIPDALVIPASSESGGFVWRQSGGQSVKTPVKTGIRSGMRVQILDGLSEGDRILLQAPSAAR